MQEIKKTNGALACENQKCYFTYNEADTAKFKSQVDREK